MKPRRPVAATCSVCGQRGDQPPGLALREPRVEAVFVGDEAVPTPQVLECRACGHRAIVARGSIEVRHE